MSNQPKKKAAATPITPQKRRVKKKEPRPNRMVMDKETKVNLLKYTGAYFEVVSSGVTVDVLTKPVEAVAHAHKLRSGNVIVYQMNTQNDTKFPVFIKKHNHVVKNLFTEQRQKVMRQKWDTETSEAA